MDIAQYVVGATAIIGFVNGVKLATDQKWRNFALFMVAVVAGSIFGYLHWFGLPSLEIGFAVGLASSGTYEVAQRVGGN